MPNKLWHRNKETDALSVHDARVKEWVWRAEGWIGPTGQGQGVTRLPFEARNFFGKKSTLPYGHIFGGFPHIFWKVSKLTAKIDSEFHIFLLRKAWIFRSKFRYDVTFRIFPNLFPKIKKQKIWKNTRKISGSSLEIFQIICGNPLETCL